MVSNVGRVRHLLWPFISLLASLSGCAPLSEIAGVPAVIGGAELQFRNQLALDRVPLPRPAVYSPMTSCTYLISESDILGRSDEMIQKVSIRRVRDRILVTSLGTYGTSTALISPLGKLYDFNVPEPRSGGRANPENISSLNPDGRGVPVLIQFQYLYPEFISIHPQLDQVAAEVRLSNQRLWGQYIYRGIAQYEGLSVAVFDLVNVDVMPGARPKMIGFSLVDISNMSPVLVVKIEEHKMEYKRVSCP